MQGRFGQCWNYWNEFSTRQMYCETINWLLDNLLSGEIMHCEIVIYKLSPWSAKLSEFVICVFSVDSIVSISEFQCTLCYPCLVTVFQYRFAQKRGPLVRKLMAKNVGIDNKLQMCACFIYTKQNTFVIQFLLDLLNMISNFEEKWFVFRIKYLICIEQTLQRNEAGFFY